jgi:hypothetical protein
VAFGDGHQHRGQVQAGGLRRAAGGHRRLPAERGEDLDLYRHGRLT